MKPNTSHFCQKSALPTIGLMAAALVLAGSPSPASAAERRFVYSYEAQSYVPGSVEMENWVTWRENRGGNDRFDFRHEIEVGVTERLQLGFYLADWRYEENAGAKYRDSAIEAIYNLSNPNTDWIGSSLYGEVYVGPELFELEGKLLLQKNWGPWALAYNFTLEAEWEGKGRDETKGVFAHTVGLSYSVSPKTLFGMELLTEVEAAEWSNYGPHSFYLGPNTSLRFGKHWVTAAALWQVTDTDDPDFQLRAIWGMHF